MKIALFMPAFLLAVIVLAVACGNQRKATQEAGGAAQEAETVVIDSDVRQRIDISAALLETLPADTIDLGRLTEGEMARRELELYNAGDEPFVLARVSSSCGCTKISYTSTPIKPGESGRFLFTFDSSGQRGQVFKTMSLQTSLSSTLRQLVVKAEVTTP